MILSALFAFLHYLAVFGIVATLSFEWLTMSRAPTYLEARRIQWCDRWYGIFAGLLIVVGLMRVFQFEKGKDFYFSNPFFRLKLTLFVVLGLLSIYPTVTFIGWRKDTARELPPKLREREFTRVMRILRIEMAMLLAIALCASLMARGITP